MSDRPAQGMPVCCDLHKATGKDDNRCLWILPNGEATSTNPAPSAPPERPGECDCREIEARDGFDPTGRICSCECHWRGHRNRQCPGCLGTIERGDCSRHGEAPNGCCKPGRILPAPPADVAGPNEKEGT